ncbi:hypothetical protein PTKIN_Ptkin09bG0011000 [Pterospermum kingtungense]
MDIRNGTDIAETVAESNNLEFNTLSSFFGGLATSCEETETKAWTNPNHAELVMENQLIPQESYCGMEMESQKVKGLSLTENFRARQIKEHKSNLQCFDKVPEAGLAVRVALSVDKLVRVKKQLLDIFHDENYPTEFSYKSKKIDEVDVCLFSMYV